MSMQDKKYATAEARDPQITRSAKILEDRGRIRLPNFINFVVSRACQIGIHK